MSETERRTLGISRKPGEGRTNERSAFALTGARYEKLRERAREERRHPSEAQTTLWAALSGSKLGGVKFSRQMIVGSVLADFAAPARWIVVQISRDGASPELDALQDGKLADIGVRVLRFAADAVLNDLEAVTGAINDEIAKPFDKRTARKEAGARFVSAGD